MSDAPAPVDTPIEVAKSVARAQARAQLRMILAAGAGALVGKHIVPAGIADDTTIDALTALAIYGLASFWQWARVRIQHSRLWQLAIDPRVPDSLVRPAPASTMKE